MRSYGQYCSIAKALDVVGDRWTLLIVRELLIRGACRYTDLKDGLPGIATNLLADRLRELESAGLIRREEAPPPVATGPSFRGAYSCMFPVSIGSGAIIAATASGIGTSWEPLHSASSTTTATFEILSSFEDTFAATTCPLRIDPSRSLQSSFCQAFFTFSSSGEPGFRNRASIGPTSSA